MVSDKIFVPYKQFRKASEKVAQESEVTLRMIREKDRGIIEVDRPKQERGHKKLFYYDRFGDDIELRPTKLKSKQLSRIQQKLKDEIEKK